MNVKAWTLDTKNEGPPALLAQFDNGQCMNLICAGCDDSAADDLRRLHDLIKKHVTAIQPE